MKCPYCGASRFRISHLRFSDLLCLVVFRYPVRCRLCRERIHVSLPEAMRIRRASRLHKHVIEEPEQKQISQDRAAS